MIRKRLASAILACMLLFSCSLVPITAVEAPAPLFLAPNLIQFFPFLSILSSLLSSVRQLKGWKKEEPTM